MCSQQGGQQDSSLDAKTLSQPLNPKPPAKDVPWIQIPEATEGSGRSSDLLAKLQGFKVIHCSPL